MPSLGNSKVLPSGNNKNNVISARDAGPLSNCAEVWQEIADDSKDGWIWHTWLFHKFNLSAGEKYESRDLSFFIFDGEKAVGLVPLIIQKKTVGNYSGWEASNYAGFLPWPCFRHKIGVARAAELEDFAFKEIETQARKVGAGHIKVMLTPPQDIGNEVERVRRVVFNHKYIASALDFHRVIVEKDTLAHVRVCSRQYQKRFGPLFELSIVEGKNVTEQVEKEYLRLHVKDAGGQFRSDDSYKKQADFARYGEAFYVVAKEKTSGMVAGMLLIDLYKNAAYDGSVAIDPSFKDKRIGHLLKWRAVEELFKRGIKTYELGPRYADPSTLVKIGNSKERGINEFKEGWARGQTRKIFEIEKFLSKDFLDNYMNTVEESLYKYFEL